MDSRNHHKEGICPQCGYLVTYIGSGALDEHNDKEYYFRWNCGKCRASGREYHILSFGEHLFFEDEETKTRWKHDKGCCSW